MKNKMKFLVVESFYSGSHKLFADGLLSHTTHQVALYSMPGQNYRWRMLGAAVHLSRTIQDLDRFDGIMVTDMFNLCDFKAIVGPAVPPVMVYFHENQLTYPHPAGDKSTQMLGMINITTAMAADHVVFNSYIHKESFLKAIPIFLNRCPDLQLEGLAEKIRQKSAVLYPGVDAAPASASKVSRQTYPPLIIWNHRWGYDKNFELFFKILEKVRKAGLDFRLALLGENFGKIPDAFSAAKAVFGDKILQFGYVEDRATYFEWLHRGAIVISTATQENFGISVIEAMAAGCLPLLPCRLSYPEILPPPLHDFFLYQNQHDLFEKLCHMILHLSDYDPAGRELRKVMTAFSWENAIKGYDRALSRLTEIP